MLYGPSVRSRSAPQDAPSSHCYQGLFGCPDFESATGSSGWCSCSHNVARIRAAWCPLRPARSLRLRPSAGGGTWGWMQTPSWPRSSPSWPSAVGARTPKSISCGPAPTWPPAPPATPPSWSANSSPRAQRPGCWLLLRPQRRHLRAPTPRHEGPSRRGIHLPRPAPRTEPDVNAHVRREIHTFLIANWPFGDANWRTGTCFELL